jgi:hypothetical protein
MSFSFPLLFSSYSHARSQMSGACVSATTYIMSVCVNTGQSVSENKDYSGNAVISFRIFVNLVGNLKHSEIIPYVSFSYTSKQNVT